MRLGTGTEGWGDDGVSGTGTGVVWHTELAGMAGMDGGLMDSTAKLYVELHIVLRGSELG